MTAGLSLSEGPGWSVVPTPCRQLKFFLYLINRKSIPCSMSLRVKGKAITSFVYDLVLLAKVQISS